MIDDDADLQSNDDSNADSTTGTELDPQQWDARSVYETALERVRDQASAHPLATIGIASGVGYVLGRGLPKLGVMFGLALAGGAIGFGLPALMRRNAESPRTSEGESEGESEPTPQSRSGRRKRRAKSKGATGVSTS